VGVQFHEIRLETNAHNIMLICSDLQVLKAGPGYAPFVVERENHYVPPTPL
jgi:hypothetical protein